MNAVEKNSRTTTRRHAVSETRSNERYFRTLVEHSFELIGVLDRQGRILFINRAIERIAGRPKEAFEGQALLGWVDADSRPHLQSALKKAWQEPASVRHLSFRVLHDDLSLRELRATVLSLSDLESEPVLLLNASDVTDERILQREMLEINESEHQRIGQALHDDLGQMLTAAALRLATLRTVLQKPDSAGPALEQVGTLEHLLIQSTKAARSLARGLNPFDMDDLDFGSALQELSKRMEGRLGVAFLVDCPRDLGFAHPRGAHHLLRIVQECYSNAVKHGRAQRVKVKAALRREFLEVSISDNGQGFWDEQDLCEGMNLRTIEYRVSLLDGEMEVSTSERGTKISIRFRLEKGEASGQEDLFS